MIINVCKRRWKRVFLSKTVNVIEASLELSLTSLIAFLRSSHSFHSYDLTRFVSIGWMSVCAPLSHLVIGFNCKLSPGCICKTTRKKKWSQECKRKKWSVRAGSSVVSSHSQHYHWIISDCMYVFERACRPQSKEWRRKTLAKASGDEWAQGRLWLSLLSLQQSYLHWWRSSRLLLWSWKHTACLCVWEHQCVDFL